MKILIDECLPRKLKNALSNHDVQTVPQAGWAGEKNGELLSLMSDVYDVFITVDSNMQYQQNLADMSVGFILLSAKNNKLETPLPLISDVEIALETIESGQLIMIEDTS
jgi:predicted nuclease of predicted toxin-antitoxin system